MSWSLTSALKFALNPVAGAIDAIGGFIGDKATESERKFNASEADKNRQYQTSERLATQEWNEQMWNKNNEYNSPQAQVQRALDAGVNPASLFGDGSKLVSSSAPSTSPMSGGQASYSSNFASSLLSSFSQNVLALAQARNLDSNTDLNTYQLGWNTLTEKERYDTLVNMNNKSKAEVAKIFSDVGVNDFNKELQTATFSYFAQKSEEEIKLLKEQLNNLRNQNLDILKGIELKDSQIRKTDAETDLIGSQKAGQDADNKIQNLMVEYSNITGIPVGAPESHALFTLWQQGRFDELCDKLTINDYSSPNGIDQLPVKFQAGNDLEKRFKEPRNQYKSHYWDNWRNHNNPNWKPK